MAIIIPTSHLVVFLAPVDRRCRNTPVPVGRSRLRRRRHLGALAMSDIFPPLLSHFFSLPSSIRLDGRGRERGGSGGGEMLKFSGLASALAHVLLCFLCVRKRQLDQLEINKNFVKACIKRFLLEPEHVLMILRWPNLFVRKIPQIFGQFQSRRKK